MKILVLNSNYNPNDVITKCYDRSTAMKPFATMDKYSFP